MGDNQIGRRLRALRGRRTLESVAGLAGITKGYLSRLERGLRPVNSRNLLEALAAALNVAPSELIAMPVLSHDPVTAEAQSMLAAVEVALSDYRLGEETDVVPREWPEIRADLVRLNAVLRPNTDYAAQGMILPTLIPELITLPPSRDVLRGLFACYHSAAVLTKNLGAQGLPQLAAFHAQTVADALSDPEWVGLGAWLRAHAIGGSDRPRQLRLSLRSARLLESELDNPDARQVYGMLHLNCALASAAKNDAESALDHLREADSVATEETGSFGSLYFGKANVGIWRVSLETELGYGGKVRETAQDVNPGLVPSDARRAMFYADLGRALSGSKQTRDEGVRCLAQAERIAPQRIRSHALVRATVEDLVNRAKRDAVGRELRGMAYRMGVGE